MIWSRAGTFATWNLSTWRRYLSRQYPFVFFHGYLTTDFYPTTMRHKCTELTVKRQRSIKVRDPQQDECWQHGTFAPRICPLLKAISVSTISLCVLSWLSHSKLLHYHDAAPVHRTECQMSARYAHGAWPPAGQVLAVCQVRDRANLTLIPWVILRTWVHGGGGGGWFGPPPPSDLGN